MVFFFFFWEIIKYKIYVSGMTAIDSLKKVLKKDETDQILSTSTKSDLTKIET